MTEENEVKRPKLKLIGENGNVFNLIAKATYAGEKAGWSPTQITWFMDQCKSGNYDNALRTIMTHFDVY